MNALLAAIVVLIALSLGAVVLVLLAGREPALVVAIISAALAPTLATLIALLRANQTHTEVQAVQTGVQEVKDQGNGQAELLEAAHARISYLETVLGLAPKEGGSGGRPSAPPPRGNVG